MKFLRSLYVYWPVLRFASTAVPGWVVEGPIARYQTLCRVARRRLASLFRERLPKAGEPD